jgi:hypothetical protein
VKVVACDRGCIRGLLEWLGGEHGKKFQEKVTFTLLEIRQGYTVVGEVAEGPKLLSSLCWKLQSVNGLADSRPGWIRRGDMLMLEGPRWATKRLMKVPKLPSVPQAKPLEFNTTAAPASSSRSNSNAPLPEEPSPTSLHASTPPQAAKPSRTERFSPQAGVSPAAAALPATAGLSPYASRPHVARSIDFEVVHVSIAAAASSSNASDHCPDEARSSGRGFHEATEVSSASQEQRPAIPVLDLAAVGRQREAVHKVGKFWQPHNVCDESTGCQFSWVEMLLPAKKSQGKKEKDAPWKCL